MDLMSIWKDIKPMKITTLLLLRKRGSVFNDAKKIEEKWSQSGKWISVGSHCLEIMKTLWIV